MCFSQNVRSEMASGLPVDQTIARNSCCFQNANEQETSVDERGSCPCFAPEKQTSVSESVVNRKIVHFATRDAGTRSRCQPELLALGIYEKTKLNPRGHARRGMRNLEWKAEEVQPCNLGSAGRVQRDLQGCGAGCGALCARPSDVLPVGAWVVPSGQCLALSVA